MPTALAAVLILSVITIWSSALQFGLSQSLLFYSSLCATLAAALGATYNLSPRLQRTLDTFLGNLRSSLSTISFFLSVLMGMLLLFGLLIVLLTPILELVDSYLPLPSYSRVLQYGPVVFYLSGYLLDLMFGPIFVIMIYKSPSIQTNIWIGFWKLVDIGSSLVGTTPEYRAKDVEPGHYIIFTNPLRFFISLFVGMGVPGVLLLVPVIAAVIAITISVYYMLLGVTWLLTSPPDLSEKVRLMTQGPSITAAFVGLLSVTSLILFVLWTITSLFSDYPSP